MILVTNLTDDFGPGRKLHYGRFIKRDGTRLVADWCADADFAGPIHQEGVEEHLVSQLAAAGWVREDLLVEVEQRVERINRQARKVGTPKVEVIFAGESLKTKKQKLVDGEWVPVEVERWVKVHVIGTQPVLAGGWRLAGLVDYRQAVPIVSTVPGEELPVDPRGLGPICQHCGTNRRRAEVFVLVDAAGAGRQVGRNCLGDFLGLAGNDPALALFRFGSLGEILAFDEEAMGAGGRSGFYLDQILTLTAAILNVSGWVSKARSEIDGLPSTTDRISQYLFPPNFSFDGRKAAEYRAWRAEVGEWLKDGKREALTVEVEAAKAWAQGRSGTEFDKELGEIAQCPFLGFRYLGRAAYILAGYRKEQERLVEAARAKDRWARSAHIGEVGKRMSLELELVGIRLIEGDFGTTTLATFDDGKGNQVKWFASNFPEWPVGEKRTVKATVKKHDEYKGTAQTVVTRIS